MFAKTLLAVTTLAFPNLLLILFTVFLSKTIYSAYTFLFDIFAICLAGSIPKTLHLLIFLK